jgi:hypothetical protein
MPATPALDRAALVEMSLVGIHLVMLLSQVAELAEKRVACQTIVSGNAKTD